MVKEAAVAPAMFVQVPFTSFCHWQVKGAVPPATTLNDAECPALTV
jgi:hypothetical protein